MSGIQAMVRYEDGTTHEVWDVYRAVEFIPDVDKINKITFYNDAKAHVYNNFRGIPNRVDKGSRAYITYVGDMAQFIVFNW